MSVIYNDTVKNTRMTDVVTAIGATGYIEILTSADALLCTITLANPAGTVAGSGVLTFTVPRSGVASGAGTAAKARVRNGSAADIITGLTVGTAASDIIVGTTTIASGNTVNITSAVLTHG